MADKNILIVTSMYPLLDQNYEGTKVCHYFAKEWKMLGYNVRVIRLTTCFPRIAYYIGDLFKEFIKAKTGAVVYTTRKSKYEKYILEGIPVLLTPVYKLFPHIVPSERYLEKALQQPIHDLLEEGFVPDYITAHFQNPQLKALFLLKQTFSSSKVCMVMHNGGGDLSRLYKTDLPNYMDNVDVWGFRSQAFKNHFEKIFGVQKRTFICSSGIPETYITPNPKTFNKPIKRYAFLGSLFELKRVKDTIIALSKAYPNKDFIFDIIGDGAEANNLKQTARKYNVENQVIFHGFKPRDEAQQIVANADVFVMVSAHEAFGLVYIEAMGKGCITIGTKGQGIDGIIKSGENGFLCESCNPDALSELICHIKELPFETLNQISRNAHNTALNMTNKNVAINYINNIKN